MATCTSIPSWARSQIYLLVTFGFRDRVGSTIFEEGGCCIMKKTLDLEALLEESPCVLFTEYQL